MKPRAYPPPPAPTLTAAELIEQLSRLPLDTYVYLVDYGMGDPDGTILGIEGVMPVSAGPLKDRQVIAAHSRGPAIHKIPERAPVKAKP
jgi:hypothetical protein